MPNSRLSCASEARGLDFGTATANAVEALPRRTFPGAFALILAKQSYQQTLGSNTEARRKEANHGGQFVVPIACDPAEAYLEVY
jgi:hypothetical protein